MPRTGQCDRQRNKTDSIRREAHGRRHEADALEAIGKHANFQSS